MKNRASGSILANASVFTKFMISPAVALLALAALGIVTATQLSQIGKEIQAVGTQDLPLTKNMTELEINTQKQGILLERLMRVSGITSAGGQSVDTINDSIKSLRAANQVILKEALDLGRKAEAQAVSDEYKAELKALNTELTSIMDEVKVFDDDSAELVMLISARRMEQAEALAQKIIEEEEDLTKHLEEALKSIQAFTESALANAYEHEQVAMRLSIIINIVSIAVVLFLSWVIAKRFVARPLESVTSAMTRLSAGDTNASVDYEANDEVGTMAKTFEIFRQRMLDIKRMEVEQKEAEKKAEIDRRKALLDMADSFERQVGIVVQTVASAATEMQATSAGMARIAGDASEKASTVAAAAEQASANVSTVAAASEELVASVGEIGRQLTISNKATEEMSRVAADTEVKVKNLVEAAIKIGEVVALIDNIASQTNLLALNATIEAARAGEAGKGFSVVASEVKELASQTSKATEEITRTITSIQHETRATSDAIGRMTAAVGNIAEVSNTISAAVEEQSAVTRDISRNVQEAAAGTSEVSRSIHDVRQGSVETEKSATDVLNTAEELSKQSNVLTSEVRSFMSKVREG